MRIDDIALFFANCDGNKKFFSQYLRENFSDVDFSIPLSLTTVANHILSDIEYLYAKSLINIIAADDLSRRGFFNWSAVSAYYSSFFSAQAINRLHVNFITREPSFLHCNIISVARKEIELHVPATSQENHVVEFDLFFENVADERLNRLSDRHWDLGLAPPRHGTDNSLRNSINYRIDTAYYYELTLDNPIFKKIIKDNEVSPYQHRPKVTRPVNYTFYFVQRGTSRLNVLSSILRYIAQEDPYYRTYFNKRMADRRKSINAKFPNISKWLKIELENCLQKV